MFQAAVILWCFETCQIVSKYDIHKVRVESVTFSCDSKYVVSLGGRDDGTIIVWNVEKGEAVCGTCQLTVMYAVHLCLGVPVFKLQLCHWIY
jgi:WD40 repeat protein